MSIRARILYRGSSSFRIFSAYPSPLSQGDPAPDPAQGFERDTKKRGDIFQWNAVGKPAVMAQKMIVFAFSVCEAGDERPSLRVPVILLEQFPRENIELRKTNIE